MLTEIERREKRQKLRGDSVCRIIEMKVEVAGMISSWGVVAAEDTIRYDTRCYFNVRSKADISQLNL